MIKSNFGKCVCGMVMGTCFKSEPQRRRQSVGVYLKVGAHWKWAGKLGGEASEEQKVGESYRN